MAVVAGDEGEVFAEEGKGDVVVVAAEGFVYRRLGGFEEGDV